MKRFFLTLLLQLSVAVPSLPQQAPTHEPDLDAPATTQASGQPSFKVLRSPLKAHVTDRRFYTREAMYLANEMNQSGDPFLTEARLAGLPIDNDRDFQYITATES